MILRVNPNRMELLRLRKRLALAERGHKLLQDKLEEMMRRLLVLLKEVDRAHESFREHTRAVASDLLYCRITSSKEDFETAIAGVKVDAALNVATTRIMNVRVPEFVLEKFSLSKSYSFLTTSAQFDLVVARTEEYWRALLLLAKLLKSLDILSREIERTRRRVNALEYILIPSIKDTIRSITIKLNELERGNLTRLMRVKEIVRSH